MFLAAVVAATTVLAGSSVWRAELDGEVVYLGGTCHMLRASDFPLPAEFDAAYAEADTLYFETDLNAMQSPAVQMKILEEGMLGDGTVLSDHLKPETWAALEEHCAKHGLPLAAFAQMKPWLLTVTLAVLEWQKNGAVQEGVDMHYHALAEKDGKTTAGLEDIDAHLQFVISIGDGQEDEMLLSTLRDLETLPQMVSELIAAWRSGDIETMDTAMMADMRKEFPKVYTDLVTGRNHDWVPQVLAMFKQPGTEYVLVGVGHFGGEEGLIALLEAEGVTIELVEVEE